MVLAVGLVGTRARAQAPDAAEPPASDERAVVTPAASTVEVALDPSTSGLSVGAVDEALGAYLADTGLTVRVTAQAEPTPDDVADATTIRVWLSRTDDASLRIDLWLPGHDGAWTRVLPDAGDPALLVEELGVVVRGMVRPGPAIEPEPPPPPPAEADPVPAPAPTPTPAPEAAPPRTPAPRAVWDVRVGYRGDTVSRQIPWHHGLEVGAGVRVDRLAIAELTLGWIPPQREAGVAIQRIPIDVGAGFRLRPDARVRFAVLGLVTVEPLGWSGAAAGFAASPGWTVRLGLGAAADLRVGFARRWFGYARATIRGWPVDTDLVVETSAGPRALADGPGVTVAATAGLGVRFFFIRNGPPDATSRSDTQP